MNDLVIAVAAVEIDDVGQIAGVLFSWQAGAPQTLAEHLDFDDRLQAEATRRG
jgi:hypothetical protein